MKKILRKQTEADLLFNALKAVGIIKEEGEKKEKMSYYSNIDAILNKQLAASKSNAYNTGLGFLGGVSYGF